MRARRLLSTTLLAGLAAASPAALASDVNLLDQTAYVSLGVFTNASKLELRVDGEAGEIGTPINWNSTFGDQNETRARLDALWRISGRHHLRLMYTDYSRTSSRTIEEEIIWQGETITVGASATAKFGFEVLGAAYQYAFMQSDTLELSGSLGLHYTRLEASLRAEVDLGEEVGTVERGGPAEVDAPLPVIGLRGLWRFYGDFYLDTMGQAFYLSIDEYDGSILNGRAVVIWQPRELIGLGFGYDWFRVNVEVDASRLTGDLQWLYSGPQVFFNISF
jgi:hypothetical protein